MRNFSNISHLFWMKSDVYHLQHFGSQFVQKELLLFLKMRGNASFNKAHIMNSKLWILTLIWLWHHSIKKFEGPPFFVYKQVNAQPYYNNFALYQAKSSNDVYAKSFTTNNVSIGNPPIKQV